jgi:hypothetical protein
MSKLVQFRNNWEAVLFIAMNLLAPKNAGIPRLADELLDFIGLPPLSQVTWSYNKVRELVAVKIATHLTAEYYRGRLQSTLLGKLCTYASA